MTIAEIKIEALKMMFTSTATNLAAADIDEYYADELYAEKLYAMDGSIDRCFDRIKAERLQPKKSLVLTGLGTVGTYRTVYDLSTVSDYYAVDRVVFEDESGNYDASVEFIMEEKLMRVWNKTRTGEYRLIYYTELATSETLGDTGTVLLDADVARLIPYFVKGELYQDDEPNLAGESRNLFEQMLAALRTRTHSRQSKIKMVYKQ